jgi:predicted unusual protein kinase regulating ubiquinone biosynthesis (AarF/ABC1/UbiB family)
LFFFVFGVPYSVVEAFCLNHCKLQCLDNFNKLNNSSKYLCSNSGKEITILLMPNIQLGDIGNYKWNRDNFDILKNVIKHVIISLLYAYTEIGFIHRDLHLGNILLKKTKRKALSYGDLGTLELMGILPVIMDYDKSIIQNNSLYLVYDDIERFINLSQSDMFDIRINIANIINILDKLMKENREMKDIISLLFKEVDKFTIRRFVSEAPRMPNFLKPMKI